jgi:hypothetical protein
MTPVAARDRPAVGTGAQLMLGRHPCPPPAEATPGIPHLLCENLHIRSAALALGWVPRISSNSGVEAIVPSSNRDR